MRHLALEIPGVFRLTHRAQLRAELASITMPTPVSYISGRAGLLLC